MKKSLYAFLFATTLLAGCAKTEPEPEPAEQVIGTYDVKSLSASANGIVIVGYEFPATITDTDAAGKTLRFEVSQTLDVAKKSANSVTIVSTTFEKNLATGKVETSKDPFDDVELKKNDTGAFDMIDAQGKKVGTATKDEMNFVEEEEVTDNGQKFLVKITIKAKRKA
ncbi:MAG: hypothetical protein MUE30_04105 [Spirosomaceae bacterium]|jgi:nucleosome binding factor SPN SPT16 subunit|nr:hypothetical protein [Spirosomataceae bacterium]